MARLLILPGDGIGPEVTTQAITVLDWLKDRTGLDIQTDHGLLGGAAVDATGQPAPQETLEAAIAADAVLLGAVGGPAWDQLEPELRPEAGLLKLRQYMGVYANIRPALLYPPLAASSSLREELVSGLDIVIVRELIGGIYFGKPRGTESGPPRRAFDTMVYDEVEIRRVADVAFEAARGRNGRLTSVDKANVLASSRLWRAVVNERSADYPDVQLEHLYVDNAAMQLAMRPKQFDVLLTGNLFGDILSDLAGALTGSIGMLPSASIKGTGQGVYEPCHGSAPDIAGADQANPLAAILSLAMLLRYSLKQQGLAGWLEATVAQALQEGLRTADLLPQHADNALSTEQAGQAVLRTMEQRSDSLPPIEKH
ncbi:MAG: 3-isopropylmalate dehydrogenase [Gammaproteobacteria bacterium]